ncbi:MAG TPA: (Fe-S)-binding protein [Anaeromyxobacteraceae bacterium]|nr:(Fe-S)-binding protein [Anaeromyxobacteraceae bacterium]
MATAPATARPLAGSGPARAPADECVHCGFCLPHCPTYVSWGLEADSPRGRIDLFRALEDGRVALDAEAVEHFDRCLGCLACVEACPSGVRYGEIVDEARVLIERTYRRPLRERLHRAALFALFPYPRRLRLVAVLLFLFRVSGLRWVFRRTGLLRLASARLAGMEALAPPLTLRQVVGRLKAHTAAEGPERLRVGLVAGCVQRVFFPQVNDATLRVLAAEGCAVVVPRGQGCCGALSAHAGREESARRMVRDLILRFEAARVDLVVVNAAGCGSHLKECGRLLANDPVFAARAAAFAAKVRDVTELVAALEPRAERRPLPARVAYHASCHLGHAQGLHGPPRALLRAIPGLELVEVLDGEACCGSAGVYNLLEPESAAEVGRRKAAHLVATGAEFLASANPGCTLHVQRLLAERGVELPAAHPIEILDWSLRGEPLPVGRSRRAAGPDRD